MGQYEGKLGTEAPTASPPRGTRRTSTPRGSSGEDDYQSGKIGFYDSYDLQSFSQEAVPEGGDASRYSIAGDIETRVGRHDAHAAGFLIKRDMRLLENFTGFLLDVQEPLQTVHAQRGDMIDLNVHELTIGARGAARLHGKAFGQPQELEFGYFARGDDAAARSSASRRRPAFPTRRTRTSTRSSGTSALYARREPARAPWLKLRGGVRGDY